MSEQTKKIAKKKVTLETLADTVETLTGTVETLSGTVETLAQTVAKGFAQAKRDNEDLAMMVAKGFEEMGKEMNGKFSEVNGRLYKLEQGQEEIQMRLTNVAYRFELVDLQSRVQKIEDIVLRKKR